MTFGFQWPEDRRHRLREGAVVLHDRSPHLQKHRQRQILQVSIRRQPFRHEAEAMIRKLSSGQYRLYSRKKNPKTGRKRNLGTFATREAAEKHERAVQFFKRH